MLTLSKYLKTPDFFYNKKNIINKFSFVFFPLEILYVIIFSAIFLYKKYFLKFTPKSKVICVGNLVLGGAGKTEIAILIAKNLEKIGVKFCFLTRGYKREESGGFLEKNCEILQDFSAKYGDESLLLSKYGDVFVKSDRKEFLTSSVCKKYDFVIMDDGFSDSRIEKTLTFLLFDANFLIGNGRFLPIGPLRIPFFLANKLTNAIIFTNKKGDNDFDKITKKIDNCEVLFSEIISEKSTNKNEYIAFSGLGLNQKFFNTLEKNGFNLIKKIEFEDHKVYKKQDMEIILNFAKKLDCKNIITTSKDFVKLDKSLQKSIIEYKISHEVKNFDIFLQKSLQIKK